MDVPTHCDCDDELVLHCGSPTCTWLRCPNARCVWAAWDVERALRIHRDGHVEATPA